MIWRSYNPETMRTALEYNQTVFPNLDYNEWLNISDNLMLVDHTGSISLWEKGSDGIYSGHIFFYCKGKDALSLGRDMINAFWDLTDAKCIRGLTPLTNRKARWLARQLGFKSYGVIDPTDDPCELFILTKENN